MSPGTGTAPPQGAPSAPLPTKAVAGFIQFEAKKNLLLETRELKVGQTLRMNYSYANRRQVPVHDVQSWGTMTVLDPDKNQGTRIKPLFLEGLKVGYKKFKGQGGDLGVGIENWNTAVGYPLKQEELDGLMAGTLRVNFMAGGAWTDDEGKEHFWVECSYTNWPGSATLENFTWKTC